MNISLNKGKLLILIPLTCFATGTLYVGSAYGPVSAFIPFWASIFLIITCLVVLGGLDGSDPPIEDTQDNNTVNSRSVLAAMIWISLFVVLAYIFGLIGAAVIYTFCSMYIFGGKKLLTAGLTSFILGLILFGLFDFVLEKELYRGVFLEGFT